jgi:hypothetical protein
MNAPGGGYPSGPNHGMGHGMGMGMGAPPPPGGANAGAKNPNYFTDKKKGEVNELKNVRLVLVVALWRRCGGADSTLLLCCSSCCAR